MNFKKFRKVLASVCALAVTFSLVIGPNFNTAGAFDDVSSDAWYAPYVEALADLGVVDDGDIYDAGGDMNRVGAAKVLTIAAGYEVDEDATCDEFADIAADFWGCMYIQALYDEGIISGYENGNFGAADAVTRAQFAKMAVNAFELPESDEDNPFADVSGWAETYVVTAYMNSVIDGYPDGTFGPDNNVNRAEVAKLTALAIVASEQDTSRDGGDSYFADMTDNEIVALITGEEYEEEEESDSTGAVTITEVAVASSTVPKAASHVRLLEFTMRATGEDVTVNDLTIARSGVGESSDFAGLYIYEGAARLSNRRSVSSEINAAEFTNLGLDLDTGVSRTFTVYGDVAAAPAGNNQDMFSIVTASDIGTNSSGSVSGSFPVEGGLMTMGGTTAGTVTIDKNGTLVDPNIGTDQAMIAKFKVTAGSEDVSLEEIALTIKGTISKTDVTNLKLYQGTTLLASTDAIGEKDLAIFDLDPGFLILDGENAIFTVKADLMGTAAETVNTYIKNDVDVVAIGQVYGFGNQIARTNYDNTTPGTDSSEVTLKGGEVTIAFNGPSASNYSINGKDQRIFLFRILSARNVDVEKLQVTLDAPASVAGGLLNGTTPNYTDIKIVRADTGRTLMGPDELATGGSDTSQQITYNDTFSLSAGESVDLAVSVDIANNAALAGDTLKATLAAIDTTDGIKDVDTGDYVTDIVPTAVLAGNTHTVQTSSLALSLASTPTADTFIKGANGIALLGTLFQAGPSSDVIITDLTFTGYIDENAATATSANYTAGLDNAVYVRDIMTAVSLYDGTTLLAGPESVQTNGTLVFDNINWTVPAGQTKKLTLQGDVSNNAFYNTTTDGVYFDIATPATDVTAEDEDTNTVTASGTVNASGGTVTTYVDIEGSGTLAVARSSATPTSGIVITGNTDEEIARWKFSAVDEIVYLEDFTIGNLNDDDSEIINLSIYDSGDLTTALDTGFFSAGTVQFQDIHYAIPKDDNATLVAMVDLNTMSAGASTGDPVALALLSVDEAKGGAGTNIAVVPGRTDTTDTTHAANAAVANNTDTTLEVVTGTNLIVTGDTIYIVDAPVVAAADSDVGTAISVYAGTDVRVTAAGMYYDDIDTSTTVTAGDLRFEDGATVVGSDSDVGTTVNAYAETDVEGNATTGYYDDIDASGTVTTADVRLSTRELMMVTAVNPAVVTVKRGVAGTIAQSAYNLSSDIYQLDTAGNMMAARKTKLTVTDDTTASMLTEKIASGEKELYRLKVTADANEDVSVKKIMFTVAGEIGGGEIGWDDTTICGTGTDGLYANNAAAGCGSIALDAVRVRTSGESTDEAITVGYTVGTTGATPADHTPNYVTIVFTTEEEIAAGTSKIYDIYGTFAGVDTSTSSSDYWSAYLGGPSTDMQVGNYAAVPATASIAWSDQSAVGHDETTGDWTNDYLVKTLKTSTYTLDLN